MRMAFVGLVLLTSLAATGCKTPVPRGHFRLPEDSFITTKKLESLVKPGMPIEQAREIMEIHGFECTFEDSSLGIPHMQCIQLKRQWLWPFHGNWMATIYFENGLVTFVQGRYDLNPTELGVRIPKRKSREALEIDRAKDAREKALHGPPPEMIESSIESDLPAGAIPVAPTSEEVMPPASAPGQEPLPPATSVPAQESLPPASVPVEIP